MIAIGKMIGIVITSEESIVKLSSVINFWFAVCYDKRLVTGDPINRYVTKMKENNNAGLMNKKPTVPAIFK
jgi:hypothetical protein